MSKWFSHTTSFYEVAFQKRIFVNLYKNRTKRKKRGREVREMYQLVCKHPKIHPYYSASTKDYSTLRKIHKLLDFKTETHVIPADDIDSALNWVEQHIIKEVIIYYGEMVSPSPIKLIKERNGEIINIKEWQE
jgi:hypothetical protein